MNFRLTFIVLVLLISSTLVGAKEIAGVKFEDTIQLSADSPILKLNGIGIRKKFFFKIYIAGLYLPSQSDTASEIIKMSGENRIFMHFLYDEVSREKLISAWNDGFKNNQTPTIFKQLAARLKQFNDFFETAHSGDVIQFDYVPDLGTTVTINGLKKGTIAGKDFNQALLSVWLGDEPADSDLKAGLLGK